MKRALSFLVLILMICSSAYAASNKVDIDLSTMSSTFVYAEVYNMLTDPDSYMGKTVRMQGVFTMAEGVDRNYYACIIADASACCSQGIEFVTTAALKYPEEYPPIGSEIIVDGVFDTYLEDGYLYCQLSNAQMSY